MPNIADVHYQYAKPHQGHTGERYLGLPYPTTHQENSQQGQPRKRGVKVRHSLSAPEHAYQQQAAASRDQCHGYSGKAQEKEGDNSRENRGRQPDEILGFGVHQVEPQSEAGEGDGTDQIFELRITERNDDRENTQR